MMIYYIVAIVEAAVCGYFAGRTFGLGSEAAVFPALSLSALCICAINLYMAAYK